MAIVRISRVVGDLVRSEAFYSGLGFQRTAAPVEAEMPGVLQARQVVMRLGREEIALVQCLPPGPLYPAGSCSDDLWFQHLAIVVSDMEAACRSLPVAAAISRNGPQRLPPRNGSMTAYKFRDPDGHPLELIRFPPGQGRPLWQHAGPGPFLGIDHSALAIRSGRDSLRFYRRLGFRVAQRSFNHGPAQSALDGLPSAVVHVTGLRIPGAAGPGLELLRYMPPGRPRPAVPVQAMLTDWVTLALPGTRPGFTSDPDGHLLLLTDQGRTEPASGPAT